MIPQKRALLRLFLASMIMAGSGCLYKQTKNSDPLARYQQRLTQYPERPRRKDNEGTDINTPSNILKIQQEHHKDWVIRQTPSGPVVELSLQQSVSKAMVNSPEIYSVSFSPSIAHIQIEQEASAFDPTAFGKMNVEWNRKPKNSYSEISKSETSLWETGLKQKTLTGTEWSTTYQLSRKWDDLNARYFPKRWEPILTAQVRQPLLRDRGIRFHLAGVDIAKLRYQAALQEFRQKAEELSTQVIAAYWQLYQAQQDLEIQRKLLDMSFDTLSKVRGRTEIDATDIQIRQAEASLHTREALLLDAERLVREQRDSLARFIATPPMDLVHDPNVRCTTAPATSLGTLDQDYLIAVALQRNPLMEQARLKIEIATINIDVAQNQAMPKIDLVGTASTQTLARELEDAHDAISDLNYNSTSIGLVMEYPLGNRQRKIEIQKRHLERRQAVSTLHNTADRVVLATKNAVRLVRTRFEQVAIQEKAVNAARIHLQALEDSEDIRQQLTAEYLLVKLQAQDSLANAQKSRIHAIIDFNIALADLTRITGMILRLEPDANIDDHPIPPTPRTSF